MAPRKQLSFEETLSFLRRTRKVFVKVYSEIERVQTGYVGLDWMLGGGLPRGRIIELYGNEDCGKTTLCAQIAAVFQKRGEVVIYQDYEHSASMRWFRRVGTDVDDECKLWLYDQPFSLEDGVDAAATLIATGGIGLVIFDSVAAMVPKAELEGDMGDMQMGLHARQIGKALRRLAPVVEQTKTTAIFINQVRSKIGGPPRMNPDIPTGGRALKYFASIRLQMRARQDGTYVLLRKQKTADVPRGSEMKLVIGSHGFDRVDHLTSCALMSVVRRRGKGYHFEGKRIATTPKAFRVWAVQNYKTLRRSMAELWNAEGRKEWDGESPESGETAPSS